MIRSAGLALAGLFAVIGACSVDDRTVTVNRACMSPPASGLLSDFSTASLGRCPAPTCPGALEYSQSVALGLTGVPGLVFPYAAPASVTLTLGLTGDLASVHDDASALEVAARYDSTGRAPPALVAGFALRFVDAGCVDVSGYAGVSFRLAGDLGGLPLRVAAQLSGRDPPTADVPCPLDVCFATTCLTAAPGLTTVVWPAGAGSRALAGLQWELGLPADGSRATTADFTIDDLRLTGP